LLVFIFATSSKLFFLDAFLSRNFQDFLKDLKMKTFLLCFMKGIREMHKGMIERGESFSNEEKFFVDLTRGSSKKLCFLFWY